MNRWQLRHHIARAIGDLILGTVTTMNGQNIRSNDLLQFPDDHWNDGEVFCYSGTGAGGSRIISDFAATLGEITPFASWGTAPIAADLFELHRYLGWMVDDYNKAIDLAMVGAEDVYLADKIDYTLTMERWRFEYPIPSGYRYLSEIAEDTLLDAERLWGSENYDVDQGLRIDANTQKLSQAFVPGNSASEGDLWVGSVRLYLRKIGTISTARTLTVRIETDSGGAPSGTLVANATATLSTDSVPGMIGYVNFAFTNPAFLTGGTTYHIVLSEPTLDATNYIAWGRDDSTSYDNGAAAKYNGSAWSTIASAAMVFALGNPTLTARFVKLSPGSWWVIRSDKLLQVVVPSEGRALRLVGQGQATALSADTDTVEVPEEYLIARAAAILLANGSAGPQTDPDARLQRAMFYEAQAERYLRKMRTVPRPNSRAVDLR